MRDNECTKLAQLKKIPACTRTRCSRVSRARSSPTSCSASRRRSKVFRGRCS